MKNKITLLALAISVFSTSSSFAADRASACFVATRAVRNLPAEICLLDASVVVAPFKTALRIEQGAFKGEYPLFAPRKDTRGLVAEAILKNDMDDTGEKVFEATTRAFISMSSSGEIRNIDAVLIDWTAKADPMHPSRRDEAGTVHYERAN